MSEWMKVMLDEIARKKSEASAAQAEIERRGREAANPSSEEASAHDAPDKAIRGKSPGGRPPPMIPLKDDTPSALPPYVTVSLIAACVAVFLWQRTLDPEAGRRAVDALGAIPAVLVTDARLPLDLQWVPRYATAFTSMFLHGGWLHLLGNMLYLWIYGDNVEDAMGHARYLVFYCLCGVAAVGVQALSDPHSAYPIIGASGAISGILGAYLLLFPRAKVLTLVLLPFFFTTLRLPAMLLLLLWFAVQLISDLAVHGGDTGVAFGAHIGGFIAGMLLVPLLKRREVRLFAH